MGQDKNRIDKQSIVRALCSSNINPYTGEKISQLSRGHSYIVEYIIIGPSWSTVGLTDLPQHWFNTILFSFFISNEKVNIIRYFQTLRKQSNKNYPRTIMIICADLSEARTDQLKQNYDYLQIINFTDLLSVDFSFNNKVD